MKRNVLIHIGFTKAASTFLQDQFFRSIDGADLILPPNVYWHPGFQDLLYSDESVRRGQLLTKYLEQFEKDKLIISSEAFCGSYNQGFMNRGAIADRLKSDFPKAKIIVVIRSQKEMVRAHYSQYVMSKVTHGTNSLLNFFYKSDLDFDKWLALDGTAPVKMYAPNTLSLNSRFLAYYELLRLYKKLFEDVKIILFENLISNPENELIEICEFAELELPSNFCLKQEKVNKSKGLRDLVINRKLNAFRQITPSSFAQKVCKGVLQTMDLSISKEVTEMTEILDSVNDLYASNNQKVMDEFGVRLDKYPAYYSLVGE